ncbi:hypothetical protein, partial [Pseudomonas aeruginosa]|uniref:hypothetical protein n=1 Tax=Pseudomonas aeruginosa TaxID=287 RepID=UPI003892AB4B
RPWLCGMMLQFQFNDRVALSSCNRPGKKHVHKFFEEKNFAPSTARDYWYAIKTLWELMGRVGEPPKPCGLKRLVKASS